jgi:cardiolipin synthase
LTASHLLSWPQDIDLVVAAYLLIELLGILSALEAILKTRTSTGAIAWSLSLVLMPVVMVPAWWVFGRRKFRGYAKARRIGKLDIHRLAADLLEALQPHRSAELPQPLRVLERIAQLPFTGGNQVRLLIDGERTFATLFEAIDQASDYILLEYYIVRDDGVGSELRERLERKARAGVRVHFLYDEIGSFQLSNRYIADLSAAGVDIRSFHTTKGRRNRFQINFRNHRKIAVIDGRFAMVGGINIGDEYRGGHPLLTPWRDTNLALWGPAVQTVQLAFLEDWFWACEQLPPLNWTPRCGPGPGVDALVTPTGPADSLDTCVLHFIQLIHTAQRRLWIVSPYFVPDQALLSALQLAALRGVDVRILLPHKTDNRLVQLASYAYLHEVQAVGIRVYRYRAGFLHQKVWLVDDCCATVGTANLDNRSCRLNFEIGALVHDREFCQAVERMLETDLARSDLLEPDGLATRGLPFRLAVRFAHLFAPVL